MLTCHFAFIIVKGRTRKAKAKPDVNGDSRSRDKGRTRKTKAGPDVSGDSRSGHRGRTRKTKAGPDVNGEAPMARCEWRQG